MQVKDIMTKNVISVSADTKIGELAEILFKNRIHAVPVMEEDKLVGIVAENDLFARDSKNTFLPAYIEFMEKVPSWDKLSGEKQKKIDELKNIKAKDVMSEDCKTVDEDLDIPSLLKIFYETKYTSLPVMNNENKLVGIVTLFDAIGLIKN